MDQAEKNKQWTPETEALQGQQGIRLSRGTQGKQGTFTSAQPGKETGNR